MENNAQLAGLHKERGCDCMGTLYQEMAGYDDIVTFGNVLAKTIFFGSEEPVENLLAYFDKPHKWESEYQMWLQLGGTFEDECLRRFEDWYDNKIIRPKVF